MTNWEMEFFSLFSSEFSSELGHYIALLMVIFAPVIALWIFMDKKRSTPSVNCTQPVEARVLEYRDTGDDLLEIWYVMMEYQYHGKTYKGGLYIGDASKQEIMKLNYPIGAVKTVFIDPADPGQIFSKPYIPVDG